jgi:hypothetical protein
MFCSTSILLENARFFIVVLVVRKVGVLDCTDLTVVITVDLREELLLDDVIKSLGVEEMIGESVVSCERETMVSCGRELKEIVEDSRYDVIVVTTGLLVVGTSLVEKV